MTDKTTTGSDAVDLDKLEALAKAATPGPWELRATEWSYYAVQADHPEWGMMCDAAPSRKNNIEFVVGANPATVLALIAQARAAAPTMPTDLSKQLRQAATAEVSYADARLLIGAAEEIERYYGGMMNWKRTAEAKDREFAEARAAAPAPAAQITVDWPPCNEACEDGARSTTCACDAAKASICRQHAAAPAATAQAAHSFLMSQDLYQFLTNAQNGIDSPATCSSANRLLVWLDKVRDALATLSQQPVQATQQEKA